MHNYNHIFPSIVQGAMPCSKYSSYSVKNCENIDTVGQMWRHIMIYNTVTNIMNPKRPLLLLEAQNLSFLISIASTFVIKTVSSTDKKTNKQARHRDDKTFTFI